MKKYNSEENVDFDTAINGANFHIYEKKRISKDIADLHIAK